MEGNNRKRIALGTEVVKTTQTHTCWGCGNKIPPGDKVIGTRVHDENIESNENIDWICYWCDVCGVYLDRHKPDPRYYGGVEFKGIIKTDPNGWNQIAKAIDHINKKKC